MVNSQKLLTTELNASEEDDYGMIVEQLRNGDYLSTSVIHITGVPLKDTLKDMKSDSVDSVYRSEFSKLLSSIHQWVSSNISSLEDISLELSWIANPVETQSYSANIEICVTIHSIAKSNNDSMNINNKIRAMISDTLSQLRYEYESMESKDYYELAGNQTEYCKAIIKHEIVEQSTIPTIDAVYTFDRIPDTEGNFSPFIESLSNSPGTIVHFQIIPTQFTKEECNVLSGYVQNANQARNGISMGRYGQISFPQADHILNTFQYYFNHVAEPKYHFNVVVRSKNEYIDRVASQIMHLLDSDSDNPLTLDTVPVDTAIFDGRASHLSPWIVRDYILQNRIEKKIVVADKAISDVFRHFPFILSIRETSAFFRLPLGSDTTRSGLTITESDKTIRKFANGIINSAQLNLGNLRSSGSSIGLNPNDLTKHMFVCGTPGSGKTSFLIGLLHRIWKQSRIPFLVIEPAKTEYRALIDLIPDLQIFTPGKEFISPLIINPFTLPDNVRLSSYKSTLKTAFEAAVTMEPPLNYIFEDALDNCYSDHGWSDHYTSNDDGIVFNIDEFIKSFRKTFSDIGYVGDARNIGRAGLVRLKRLSKLFGNYNSIPIQNILSKPTVVELAAIENREERSLFISLLLLIVLSYVNSNYEGNGSLKNIILLEEAHVLLDGTNGINHETDSTAVAQDLIKRILAESRAYGLGTIIADQSPRKVGLDIIALTDIKMSFRLVERTDRDIIADSMGMDQIQRDRLLKLRPGEAFMFFQKIDAPEEIVMSDYRSKQSMRIWISDKEIAEKISYWNNNAERTIPYPECIYSDCCRDKCDYGRRSLCKDVSHRLFVQLIGSTHDKDILRKATIVLDDCILKELKNYSESPCYVACVKIQFWRLVKYVSEYNISDDFKNNMISGSAR